MAKELADATIKLYYDARTERWTIVGRPQGKVTSPVTASVKSTCRIDRAAMIYLVHSLAAEIEAWLPF
uniref:Uncharacterized protein n=1 Tax=uncultured prokaryote TaxID=198431 RepID=A0A0H5QJT5_9ZZZZ|nr:hypothetical protein [uncultured prokaryote]